ncbi:MAG: nucleotidyl transferase AbiEii/AbiGii toxin family protein [Desulfobacteraceae bacterium]|nr:MAG: nucleotidyl transferase AbiEii/AbiGii toxin family protein [Desulfobacteraceae bacterium]
MKNYRETYVRKAEIAQLILLNQLYSMPGSRALIFQGGTALRWCYGGSRFSEDLDFVTHLDMDIVRKKLNRMLKAVERVMVPHFGPGSLSASEKTTRKDTLKLYVDYRPVSSREKISVKLEFEGLCKDTIPETQNHILSALPSVSYLIAAGDFRIPRPNTVLVAETLPEILSDKIRALLEHRYLKGRDIFDIWYLRTALNTAADRNVIERKFRIYTWPFHAARDLDFFANSLPGMRDEMIRAIREDLSRFLPPEVIAVNQSEGFASFLTALRELFEELIKKEVKLP